MAKAIYNNPDHQVYKFQNTQDIPLSVLNELAYLKERFQALSNPKTETDRIIGMRPVSSETSRGAKPGVGATGSKATLKTCNTETSDKKNHCRVMRMDTNGNEFTLQDGMSLKSAAEMAERMEEQTKGHKQTFYVDKVK